MLESEGRRKTQYLFDTIVSIKQGGSHMSILPHVTSRDDDALLYPSLPVVWGEQ